MSVNQQSPYAPGDPWAAARRLADDLARRPLVAGLRPAGLRECTLLRPDVTMEQYGIAPDCVDADHLLFTIGSVRVLAGVTVPRRPRRPSAVTPGWQAVVGPVHVTDRRVVAGSGVTERSVMLSSVRDVVVDLGPGVVTLEVAGDTPARITGADVPSVAVLLANLLRRAPVSLPPRPPVAAGPPPPPPLAGRTSTLRSLIG